MASANTTYFRKLQSGTRGMATVCENLNSSVLNLNLSFKSQPKSRLGKKPICTDMVGHAAIRKTDRQSLELDAVVGAHAIRRVMFGLDGTLEDPL